VEVFVTGEGVERGFREKRYQEVMHL